MSTNSTAIPPAAGEGEIEDTLPPYDSSPEPQIEILPPPQYDLPPPAAHHYYQGQAQVYSPPQIVYMASPPSHSAKVKLYDSGCMAGCCLTCLFGPLSLCCYHIQNTESGRLGFLRGFAIVILISALGLLVIATGLTSSKQKSIFYVLGGLEFFLGVYLLRRASERFRIIQSNSQIAP